MVDGKPIKSWQDVMESTILARTNVIPVVIEHAGVSNTYDLTTTVNEVIGLKILNLDPREHPVVGGGGKRQAGGGGRIAGGRQDSVRQWNSRARPGAR